MAGEYERRRCLERDIRYIGYYVSSCTGIVEILLLNISAIILSLSLSLSLSLFLSIENSKHSGIYNQSTRCFHRLIGSEYSVLIIKVFLKHS